MSTYQPSPSFSSIAEGLSDAVRPASFPQATLRFRNHRWARRVGLEGLDAAAWTAHFARFEPLPENLPEPLALRYHGHQFDVYNPQLGDGRGFLFAQLRDDAGRLLDLGTKGSGPTPWSRGGDGKLTLKGGVREILATEMLEALGVYTSKTFSLFETGEELWRGDEPSPTRSSVMVRLSHSHVRFGTFQRLARLDDAATMKKLVEYVTTHLVPLPGPEVGPETRAEAMLREVTKRSADLCASWMLSGFVHGVLNSDNMNVTGESFDYGPYRFLPHYDPAFTAAYFDHGGLYAFGRQPVAVARNLQRLGEALTLVADAEALSKALSVYEEALDEAVRTRFLARLGLTPRGVDEDGVLVNAAFDFLAARSVRFEQFFFDWYGGEASEERARRSPEAAAYQTPALGAFRRALEDRAPTHPERLGEAYFQREVPCTLLIDELERLWLGIAERDDWSMLEAKVADIRVMGEALG